MSVIVCLHVTHLGGRHLLEAGEEGGHAVTHNAADTIGWGRLEVDDLPIHVLLCYRVEGWFDTLALDPD
jgi:hypothetical protein